MIKTTLPKISIIILNWNGLNDTIECLESLNKITYPYYDIIVVDNNSKENNADVLEKRYKNNIKIIRNKKNFGFAGGNNIGIKYAMSTNSQLILILNNDIVVEKNFITPLIKNIIAYSKIGIIGPANYCYYEPKILFSSGRKINYLKGTTVELNLLDNPKEVDAVAGCCFLIRKEVIDKIGYFHEPYFLNFEETDYCVKAKKVGFKIICEPRSLVWHKIQASLNKIPATNCYYCYRNKFLFVKRNAPIYNKYPFYVYFTLYLLFKYMCNIIKGNKETAIAIKDAITDFWQGNFGQRQSKQTKKQSKLLNQF